MSKIPDYYQVKYRRKGSKIWKYGIFDNYSMETEGYWEKGQCVINDAILPTSTLYTYDNLEIEPISYGTPGWDEEKNCSTPGDEYSQYIEDQHEKAKEKSKKATGLEGKLFSVGVADGSAYYVVVRENKKTVRVEWRGFCPDRYTDQILGWECTLDKERIAGMIQAEEGFAKLFAK